MLRASLVGLCFVLACSSRAESPYGACNNSAVCAEETPRCVTFRNRLDGARISLCTQACTTNAECPENGVCVPTETTGLNALCLQRCALPSDCRYATALCPQVRPGDLACIP